MYTDVRTRTKGSLFFLRSKVKNMTDDSEGKKAVDQSLSKVKASYQSIDKKLALGKEDSLPLLIGKILLRILLIFLMILLSPFLIVGLILALIAAL